MNDAGANRKGTTEQRHVRPTVSDVLEDGTIVELVYRPEHHTTLLATSVAGRWTLARRVDVPGGHKLVPFSPNNNLIKNEVVLLPSEPRSYGDEQELVSEVVAFIHRYADLSQTFEQVAGHYVILSWVYDAFNDLPYLRLRGDFGTGKTRSLLTIGSLCYKPFFASGASTVSPIFHTLDAFRGTLIFDEADFRFSDERSEIVKILNNGNVRGMPVLRTVMNRQREFNPQAFHVFGPKIVATRGRYEDRALESRFITEETGARPLRDDIPINLPPTFKDEARELRNKLLLYRFRRRHEITLDPSLVDPTLEPRINQIMLPLLSVVSDPRLQGALRSAAKRAQDLIVAERGLLMEAQVLEVLMEQMLSSNRLVVPVADVTTGMIQRYGAEYERPLTNRWIGSVLRKKLNLLTYKSHGVYVVPMGEKQKVEILCRRYGVNIVIGSVVDRA
ncbi:hypothetical protein LUI11_35095 [Bradyrhizobium diazoefficiens]|uniref:hypothetical protein n=1 Tax=Bradyrhizobium TaxID=374 RepID=UPI0004570B73|nr:hypothetical protein [Bradyrhizobium diazoefficiens]MCD9296221.1 hypothetical protein [Bradyrhizobium diazoefficiens]MCD9813029.1 hypothetical protein [Bradyrhizobium diazoefficiens]MCD9831754.1 hypothetical protein [Bradyrhizobium diazoefficiens]MCD9849838.1 hypothetical protein [Bradyrhizobium diazoefficiens]MCD9887993.1 hypothetical protein [Bradyrhizobium diazoefficiens]